MIFRIFNKKRLSGREASSYSDFERADLMRKAAEKN